VPAPAVEVRDLVKRYDGRSAVDGVSLQVERGELLALLGTNGAGKTTTIEVCEGFRRPDSGSARVFGLDPHADARALRPRVGVMLQDGVGGYTGAKAGELLSLFGSYAAHPLSVDALLEQVGLAGAAHQQVKRLSGGQQQRLSLAMALVGRPELLFLDEPTTGMDPHARRTTWDLIRRLRSDGVSVVLTTHYLDEAEALADRVIVLHEGKVVADGSPADLTRAGSAGKIRFSARPELAVAELQAALPAGARVSEPAPGDYLVDAPLTPELLAAVTTWCAAEGVLAEGLTVERRRLEDVFLSVTSSAAELPGATG
jgi:ABC-2 type transport system ATP-binding protein